MSSVPSSPPCTILFALRICFCLILTSCCNYLLRGDRDRFEHTRYHYKFPSCSKTNRVELIHSLTSRTKKKKGTATIYVTFSFGYLPSDKRFPLKTIYLHTAIDVICKSVDSNEQTSLVQQRFPPSWEEISQRCTQARKLFVPREKEREWDGARARKMWSSVSSSKICVERYVWSD